MTRVGRAQKYNSLVNNYKYLPIYYIMVGEKNLHETRKVLKEYFILRVNRVYRLYNFFFLKYR